MNSNNTETHNKSFPLYYWTERLYLYNLRYDRKAGILRNKQHSPNNIFSRFSHALVFFLNFPLWRLLKVVSWDNWNNGMPLWNGFSFSHKQFLLFQSLWSFEIFIFKILVYEDKFSVSLSLLYLFEIIKGLMTTEQLWRFINIVY